MYFGYAIIGLAIGVYLASGGGDYALGAAGGALIGIVLARLAKLEQRVRELQSAARLPPRESVTASPQPPLAADSGAPGTWPEQPAPEAVEEAHPAAAEPPAEPQWAPPPRQPLPSRPSLLQLWLKTAVDWISSGNVPVKVGVIISFFGVAFLLKYAIDRKLMVIPLEFRLLAVAAAGVALIIIGWRLRRKVSVYALSLQGCGLGIIYLTIFAALRIWQLLPAPLAFFLLVALTFFTGALAVLQNARVLAVLGIAGGFLAPVLTSTGQGSHVALFSYYLVLNLAILGISWFRAWRELNLIGFLFTFLIGSFWGYGYYKPAFFPSTEPFLVLHFLLYQVIAILYALRQPPQRLGVVDGTLVFGTPIIVFALQASLVHDMEYGLAISAAAAAVFYALSATWLWRSQGARLRLLTESFMALAVAFATITLPLALDARWTSAAWALEGAALVWLGTRQGRLLAKITGTGLIFFSGAGFLLYGWRHDAGPPVLNGNVLGGALISLSALFASRRLDRAAASRFATAHKIAAVVLFIWAGFWWFGTGWEEIADRASRDHQPALFILFLGLSAGAAVRLAEVLQWKLALRMTMVYLPLLVLLAPGYLEAQEHLLRGLGWLAWPLAWAAQGVVLKVMDRHDEPLAGAWHFASLMLLALLLALEAAWWTDRIASGAWSEAVASAVAGIMALLVWRLRLRPAWPVPKHPLGYLAASVVLVSAQVLYLTALSILQPGAPDPWPYVPVLNPFDLAMLFAMVCAGLSLAALRRDSNHPAFRQMAPAVSAYRPFLAVAFLLMTTFALVRGVHYYSAVPWRLDRLFRSDTVHTALSIYWGLLGFCGMIWGARSLRRPVWVAGAGFMALVVIKLFLVDLGNTGTLERIISFIVIGALLLVVGYFAPVPPRRAEGEAAAAGGTVGQGDRTPR